MHWRRKVRLSRRLNLFLGGEAETLSARVHRAARLQGGLWVLAEVVINLLFLERDHCEDAYDWENRRKKRREKWLKR